MLLAVGASALLYASLASAQFVQTPTNFTTKTGHAGVSVRYKQVPAGICEQDPNVKSYSGFADVAENEHIFWWFFEAREVDPTTAPLTVWINGGPGSSSMIGLFQELGPCGVDYDGNVYNNPYSFSNVSNMIFIDQPTTTGLSYSIPIPGYVDPYSMDIVALPNNTCPDYAGDSCGTYNVYNVTLTANSTTAAAPNFWKTLQGFMGAFPQYTNGGFYFTTESYGGHYGPVFNNYILEQNAANVSGAAHIDLKGVLIGNGWFNPTLQYEAYYNFTSKSPGNTYEYVVYNSTLDAKVYNNMYGPHNCLDQLNDCNSFPYATNESDGQGNDLCSATDAWCLNQLENYYDIVFGRDEYDSRELNSNANPDPFPYDFYVAYLNSPEVQAAIGAFTNFSESSEITATAFASTGDDSRLLNILDACNNIIQSNVTFVMYFGDADYNCNWLGGQAFSHDLNVPIYQNDAGFTNFTTSDGVVHGQVKSAGTYSFVRIYESGHEVPFYQPLAALEMFNRTIHGLDIATGQVTVTSSYITNGTKESTYIEGNSTVVVDIVPLNATYNTTTNEPNPPYDFAIGAGASPGNSSSKTLLTRMDRFARDFGKHHLQKRDLEELDMSTVFGKYESKMGELRSKDLEPWHMSGRVVSSAKFKGLEVVRDDSLVVEKRDETTKRAEEKRDAAISEAFNKRIKRNMGRRRPLRAPNGKARRGQR